MSDIMNFHDLNKKYIDIESHMEETPEFLWHYTSANGLLGIVENNASNRNKLHFWFTRSDFLNDTSEGTHLMDIFKEVSNGLFESKKIEKDFYDYIVRIDMPATTCICYPVKSKEIYGSSSVVDVAECNMYICCFSLKEDSIDMWRYYC